MLSITDIEIQSWVGREIQSRVAYVVAVRVAF